MTNDRKKAERASLDDLFMGEAVENEDTPIHEEAASATPKPSRMEDLFYGDAVEDGGDAVEELGNTVKDDGNAVEGFGIAVADDGDAVEDATTVYMPVSAQLQRDDEVETTDAASVREPLRPATRAEAIKDKIKRHVTPETRSRLEAEDAQREDAAQPTEGAPFVVTSDSNLSESDDFTEDTEHAAFTSAPKSVGAPDIFATEQGELLDVEEDETEVLTTEELAAAYSINDELEDETPFEDEVRPVGPIIHRATPNGAESNAANKKKGKKKKDRKTKEKPEYNAAEGEKPERSTLKEAVFGWVLPILSAIVLAFFIRTFIFSVTTVRGTSMEPTFQDGNVLIVSKIPTYFDRYERGDVLIIDSPDQAELYIKRLIGLPGETVTIQDGRVFIDGKYEVQEAYIDSQTATYDQKEWTLGEHEYFVMGDNRAEGASNDSRLFGPIDKSEIEAVARLRIWPLTEIQSLY